MKQLNIVEMSKCVTLLYCMLYYRYVILLSTTFKDITLLYFFNVSHIIYLFLTFYVFMHGNWLK